MPATADNDTLLKALNQVIQALLDLSIGGGGGCPDVTVNLPAPVVNVYNTVTCGGGGSTPPQTPGEEGGTPPPGTGTPDPIDDRKCKVANILIQELVAYTDNMAALGLFDWSLDYQTLGGILNSLAGGFTNGLLSLTFQVGGWLTNLQNLIFSGGFGASIPATLSSNQEAMVCALYNSTNVVDAKTKVVTASGLTGVDASYLKTVLSTEALNMLFFSLPGSEAIIFSYNGAADCSECGPATCDDLIGQYGPATSHVYERNVQLVSWNTERPSESEFNMGEAGCYFGFKDNKITVSGFTEEGEFYNVQYYQLGVGIVDARVTDWENATFAGVYKYFQVYRSTTQFTVSFEIDRITTP